MDAPLRGDVKTLINACQQFINIYLNNYICLYMSVNHSILPIAIFPNPFPIRKNTLSGHFS